MRREGAVPPPGTGSVQTCPSPIHLATESARRDQIHLSCTVEGERERGEGERGEGERGRGRGERGRGGEGEGEGERGRERRWETDTKTMKC